MFEYNGNKFYHATNLRVRFEEVDMLGVCNNAVYISYFELSRLEYIKEAGLMPPEGLFGDGFNFFMVRNVIDYRSHARYDDELNIYTRITYIGRSSYGFEHIVVKVKNGEVVAEGSGVVAQVDQKTGRSFPLSDEFVNKVEKFERKKFERVLKK